MAARKTTRKTADKQQPTSKRGGWAKGQSGNPAKQWKRGESGNPKGRPPSKKYLSEAYREWLSLPDDKDPTLTNADVVAAMVGAAAKAGDISAAREIADRVEGRAKQVIDLSVEARRRELAERAIEGLMVDAGCERDEAISELSRLTPEIKTWIN